MNETKPIFDSNLLASFNGLSFMPKLFALGNNSMAPALRLYENHIEYRGAFGLSSCNYEDITKVDIFTMLFTKSIVLYFEHTLITFSGNFCDDQNRIACLRSFLNKGCLLTEAALTVAGVLKRWKDALYL